MHPDRAKAAQLIAQWLEARISNWDFDDAWPYESEDRAVVDIGRALWCFYSDSPEKRLEISNLDSEQLLVLKRCLAFLTSNENYEPVAYEERVPWKRGVLTSLLGIRERPWETLRLKVDPERQRWWPFADEAQCRRAMLQE